GAGARTVLEQARLAHPQVHDTTLVDEVVGNRLDEAGVRLRMLVGRARLGQLAGERVDVIVALAGTVDAVGPVQAGVEPLRRVRRDALGREHVRELVTEGEGVFFGVEVTALPAPVGPGAGETVEDLTRIGLRAITLVLGKLGERLLIGHRTPEERRDVVLLDLPQPRRDAG